jgi:hypothetical protein
LPRATLLAALMLAMKLWPPMNSGYGVAFWLWVCAVVAYALSFERARRTSALPPRIVQVILVGILILAAVLRLEGKAPNVFSSVGWFTTPNLAFAFPALAMEIGSHDLLRAARLTCMCQNETAIKKLAINAARSSNSRRVSKYNASIPATPMTADARDLADGHQCDGE